MHEELSKGKFWLFILDSMKQHTLSNLKDAGWFVALNHHKAFLCFSDSKRIKLSNDFVVLALCRKPRPELFLKIEFTKLFVFNKTFNKIKNLYFQKRVAMFYEIVVNIERQKLIIGFQNRRVL